jgi:ribonuclease VapC
MVIDTSALVAIFLSEPERVQLLQTILESENRRISAGTALETGIMLEAKRGENAGREFDLFLIRAGIEVVAVNGEQIEIARSAWRKYGKGRHSAGLNYGDCFAYSLAKLSGEPLLAKGADFKLTDIQTIP